MKKFTLLLTSGTVNVFDNFPICSCSSCKRCGKAFKEENDLKSHRESIHEDNLICPECDLVLLTENDLINHVELVHERNEFDLTFINPFLPPTDYIPRRGESSE